jgi:hypothetical protein
VQEVRLPTPTIPVVAEAAKVAEAMQPAASVGRMLVQLEVWEEPVAMAVTVVVEVTMSIPPERMAVPA